MLITLSFLVVRVILIFILKVFVVFIIVNMSKILLVLDGGRDDHVDGDRAADRLDNAAFVSFLLESGLALALGACLTYEAAFVLDIQLRAEEEAGPDVHNKEEEGHEEGTGGENVASVLHTQVLVEQTAHYRRDKGSQGGGHREQGRCLIIGLLVGVALGFLDGHDELN